MRQLVGTHTSRVDLATVKTVTAPKGANVMRVQAKTQNVHYTLDGTTPSATVGFLLVASAEPSYIDVHPGMTLQFIEVAATARLDYQFGLR